MRADPGPAVSLGSGRSHGGGHIRGGVVGRALRWIFWGMDILAGIVGQALRMIGFWWVSGMRETLTSAAQQEQAGA